jgi:hypothetical protein
MVCPSLEKLTDETIQLCRACELLYGRRVQVFHVTLGETIPTRTHPHEDWNSLFNIVAKTYLSIVIPPWERRPSLFLQIQL